MENKNKNLYSKKFKCSITGYFFHVTISNKYAYINDICTNYSNLMAFFTLMRNTIDELKTLGVRHIMKSVYTQEYNDMLKEKTTWKIVKTYVDNTCDIMCSIDDYINNFDKVTDSSGVV